MIASQALRFEAWFVIPLFAYAVLQQTQIEKRDKILLVTLLCIFPGLYSSAGLATSGNAALYYSEMSEMTKTVSLAGMWNWPGAIKEWVELMPTVIPITLLALALIGVYYFIKNNRGDAALPHQKENLLLFIVLPFFLFLMLPIQVFFHLRDWLPVRYLLIPTTLAFPLIGIGIQSMLRVFPLRNYVSLYGIVGLFMLLEMTSLKMNTHRLLSTFSAADYKYLVNEVTLLRQAAPITNKTRITILDTHKIKDKPVLRGSFMTWFLMPLLPTVMENGSTDFKPLIDEPLAEEILVVSSEQKLPDNVNLELIVSGDGYHYFRVKKTLDLNQSFRSI